MEPFLLAIWECHPPCCQLACLTLASGPAELSRVPCLHHGAAHTNQLAMLLFLTTGWQLPTSPRWEGKESPHQPLPQELFWGRATLALLVLRL